MGILDKLKYMNKDRKNMVINISISGVITLLSRWLNWRKVNK